MPGPDEANTNPKAHEYGRPKRAKARLQQQELDLLHGRYMDQLDAKLAASFNPSDSDNWTKRLQDQLRLLAQLRQQRWGGGRKTRKKRTGRRKKSRRKRRRKSRS